MGGVFKDPKESFSKRKSQTSIDHINFLRVKFFWTTTVLVKITIITDIYIEVVKINWRIRLSAVFKDP